MMMIALLLVQVVLRGTFLFLPTSCEALELYVNPSQLTNPECPLGDQCYTLSELANNASSLLEGKDNVSLLFLDGSHVTNQSLIIASVQNLTISGINKSYDISSPQIQVQVSQIVLMNILVLKIQNISINSAGGSIFVNQVGNLINYQLVLNYSVLSVAATDTLQFSQSKYIHCAITIDPSRFSFSRDHNTSTILTVEGSTIDYSSLVLTCENQSCYFSGEILNTNVAEGEGVVFKLSGGSITIHNCTISNTISGLYIWKLDESEIDIDNDTSLYVELDKSQVQNNRAYGVYLQLETGSDTNLVVSNSEFSNNGQGLVVSSNIKKVNVSVQNTCFTDHNAFTAFGFFNNRSDGYKNVQLKDVKFSNNNISEFLGPVLITGPVDLTVDNCLFSNNYAFITTLYLHAVNLLFRGNTIFSDNAATLGGAIHLGESTLWFENGTALSFVNNLATYIGGAIYVEELREQNILDETLSFPAASKDEVTCFYQLTYNISPQNEVREYFNTSIIFSNNLAQFGGNDIYGASLKDTCTVTPNLQIRSHQIENEIFHFQSQSLSSVTSNARRVCLCENGTPQCDNLEYIFKAISITSGEKFNFSAVLVGSDFGTVTGAIFASSFSETKTSFLGAGQVLQQLDSNKECTTIEYSVHSKDEEASFLLSRDSTTAASQRALYTNSTMYFTRSSIEESIRTYNSTQVIKQNLLDVPVIISATMLPCPFGFNLTETSLICKCDEFLLEYVHSCFVESGIGWMNRNSTSWVSRHTNEDNETSIILAYNYCPHDYCKSEDSSVDLYRPDSQCAFNHSGVLCGSCQSGLSLALGSSQCLPCSNDGHIALLLIFIAAGFALVFFIKILDLTVARGTINGLIFYANIIWINQDIFFPSGYRQTERRLFELFQFLKVFVAWLNLDFGIETCFFDGLDSYWKTWLQFVFPMYVWIIAGIIIVASHYSTKITKIAGNNAVAVLATLFLISYVKLQRTIVTALGYATLRSNDPKGIRTVWLSDGNVPYFGTAHTFLFLAALITLLFLWLPYTVVLLIEPLLKKASNKFILRWVNKFNPFFDAYYGPLKDKHRYWIGLTQLTRAILAIMGLSANPTANVITIAIVSGMLITLVAHVYKKAYNFVLETLFIFNLLVVSIAFIANEDTESRIMYTCASAFVSFLTFLLILAVHVYNLGLKRCLVSLKQMTAKNSKSDIESSREGKETFKSESYTSTSVNMDELRESLLDSSFV